MSEVEFDPEYDAYDEYPIESGVAVAINMILDAIADGELTDKALFIIYKMSLKDLQERGLLR